ncbi:MAG TPA: Tim44/TimA family putative adaptor protein, partial [Rhodospirillales bacterium]|nr:Tim44/TimA family putative adaptor protein [Rhodospirillales bacterium]
MNENYKDRKADQKTMGNGFPFIDIILFAMIAAFLILRLRGVLGRRDGHEGGHHDPFQSDDKPKTKNTHGDDDKVISLPNRNAAKAEDRDDAAEPEQAADANDPLNQGLAAIWKADRSFDDGEFLAGSRAAFEMILGAYVAGDTETLQSLLSPEVYGNFAKAIHDREEAGHKLEETLVGIRSAELLEAFMEGK